MWLHARTPDAAESKELSRWLKRPAQCRADAAREEEGLAWLRTRAHPGRTPTLRPEDESVVVEIARLPPRAFGQPFNQWTLRLGGAHRPQGIRCRYRKARRIYLVLDNLSTHTTKRIRQWCRRNQVSLVFIATNASWMNRLELHLTAAHYFVIKNNDPRDHREVGQRMQEYLGMAKSKPRPCQASQDPKLNAASLTAH